MGERANRIRNLLLLAYRSPFLDNDKVYPPLANLYLHQKIINERPSVDVTITDSYDLEDPQWMSQFDAVGVSIMTPQREEAVNILRAAKRVNKDLWVIAGGPHVKYYEDTMVDEGWDQLVPEDGLNPIIDILDGNKQFILRDRMHPRDFADQWVKPARLENAAFLMEFNYSLNGRNSTSLLTALGCPEHCTFCEDAKSFVRYVPLDQIKEELDDIQAMGYRGIYIFDDIFALIQKRAEPVAREIQRRGMTYRCNGQARLFTPEFADMLAETGCEEIAFGAESGSQEILDNIKKRTTVEQNYEFVRLCKDRGITTKAFLMLGLPGETHQTVRDTQTFISTSGIDDFQLAIYYPYRGTQIRDAIEAGKNTVDLTFEGEGLGAYGQKGGSTEAVVRTEQLSAQDLLDIRDALVNNYKPKSHQNHWDFYEEYKKMPGGTRGCD
jgi:radical SAM superfamily enzyme YgiQ (UPF0313 family)